MADIANAAASGVSVGWSHIKDAAVPASAAIFPAFIAAGKVIASVFDIIKFEILRDFLQFTSVFFTGLKDRMPETFRTFWGNVTSFFSVCYSCWLKDTYTTYRTTFSMIIFLIKWVLGFGAAVYFIYRYRRFAPDAKRAGLDVRTISMQSREAQRNARISVLILTTLYLPLMQDIIGIYACDLAYVSASGECFKGVHLMEAILSGLAIAVYILPIPFYFIQIIKKYKPHVSLYDSEGKKREGDLAYSDDDYRQDLRKDTNPYKALYDAYERKWSYYKVVVMIVKVLLIAPAVLVVTTNDIGGRHTVEDVSASSSLEDDAQKLRTIQSAILLGVLLMYCILAWASRPFLADSDDFLDGIGRFAALFTALLALLTCVVPGTNADSNTLKIFGIVLNIVTTIAGFLMMLLIIRNIGSVRSWWKGVRQQIELTMSRRRPENVLIFSNDELNLARERKLRIWHEAFDVIFAQDPELRIPHDVTAPKDKKDPNKYVPVQLSWLMAGAPPYLLDFKGTVEERHQENKKIAAHESVESYELALKLTTQIGGFGAHQLTNDINTAINSLTGVDVYWEGEVEAGSEGESGTEKERRTKPSSSSTHFGKMYVTPFPFCCTIVMDDTHETAIISLSPVVDGIRRDAQKSMNDFANLIASNSSQEIQRRKNVRWSLRALDGCEIDFYFQMNKTKTKTRTVTRTDSEGKTHHETESYTVTVLFTFYRGTLDVASKGDARWTNPETNGVLDVSRGFEVTCQFRDGSGIDHEGTSWTNEHERLGAERLGITPDYRPTIELGKVLGITHISDPGVNYAKNAGLVAANYSNVLSRYQVYRDYYFRQFTNKENVLSYAFWYYIYNNDTISKADLSAVLSTAERNPLVQALPTKYTAELDMVYSKLAFFNCHPSVGLWFCFWHDIWVMNQDAKLIVAKKALLSPYESTSLCYKILPRDKLEQTLSAEGLTGRRGCFRRAWINNTILDSLYSSLDHWSRVAAEQKQAEKNAMFAQFQANYSAGTHYFSVAAPGGAVMANNVQAIPAAPLSSLEEARPMGFDRRASIRYEMPTGGATIEIKSHAGGNIGAGADGTNAGRPRTSSNSTASTASKPFVIEMPVLPGSVSDANGNGVPLQTGTAVTNQPPATPTPLMAALPTAPVSPMVNNGGIAVVSPSLHVHHPAPSPVAVTVAPVEPVVLTGGPVGQPLPNSDYQQSQYQQPQPQHQPYIHGATPLAGAPPPQLPPNWAAGIDHASGRMYYMNHVTRQTQWEPPQW